MLTNPWSRLRDALVGTVSTSLERPAERPFFGSRPHMLWAARVEVERPAEGARLRGFIQITVQQIITRIFIEVSSPPSPQTAEDSPDRRRETTSDDGPPTVRSPVGPRLMSTPEGGEYFEFKLEE